VEIIMSKNLIINTKFAIKVGNEPCDAITLEDLDELCLADPSLFKEMKEKPKDIGSILLKRHVALPAQCLELLIKLMGQDELVAIAEKYLREHTRWPTQKIILWGDEKATRGLPCTWPNCPSD
jgi:hypothetical protein